MVPFHALTSQLLSSSSQRLNPLEALPVEIWRDHIAKWLTLKDGIVAFTSTCKLARFHLLRGHQLLERLIITEQSEAWCANVGIAIGRCRNKTAPFRVKAGYADFESQYCCYSDVHGRLVVLDHVFEMKGGFQFCGELRCESIIDGETWVIGGMCPIPDGRVAIAYVDKVVVWDINTLNISTFVHVTRTPGAGGYIRSSRPLCFSSNDDNSCSGLLSLIDFVDELEVLAVWDLNKVEERCVETIKNDVRNYDWWNIQQRTSDIISLNGVNCNIVVGRNSNEVYVWNIKDKTSREILVKGDRHFCVESICSLDNGGVAVGLNHVEHDVLKVQLSDIKIFNSALQQVDNIRFTDNIEGLAQVDGGRIVSRFLHYGLCVWSQSTEGVYQNKPTKAWNKILSEDNILRDYSDLSALLVQTRLLKCSDENSILLVQRNVSPQSDSYDAQYQRFIMNLIALDNYTLKTEFTKEWNSSNDDGGGRHSVYHSVTNFGHRIHLNPI